MKRTGFTLVELLVVIAILALLLAIVAPSLGKSKELTRRVICASNQKQIILAMLAYSQDHNGWLANSSMPSGPHVHDMDKNYINMLEHQYNIKRTFLYCPSMPAQDIISRENNNNDIASSVFILGYGFWIPRYSNGFHAEIPPRKSQSNLCVIDTGEYRGPKKTTDSIARMNPILTDDVSSLVISQPEINIAAYGAQIGPSACHQWRNKLEMINQAFVDGRVESKNAENVQVRYGYSISPAYRWIYR